MTLEERFDAKVMRIPESTCWHWIGCESGIGYGQIWAANKAQKAHRVSYERYVGPIPDGMEIDHLCRVRNCVNPAHLEAVTHRENLQRAQSPSIREYTLRETTGHCSRGHVFVRADERCRDCRREYDRAYNSRNREVKLRDERNYKRRKKARLAAIKGGE